MRYRLAVCCAVVALGVGVVCPAAELLAGRVVLDGQQAMDFRLTGESRENVIGGEMVLGGRRYEIRHVSRLGSIGARGAGVRDARSSEFAVFSSSFSEQTAVGQPWVAGDRYVGCQQAYNSFLAVYTVGADAATALGTSPYAALAEDLGKSSEAVVYCFVSKPSE